MGNLTLQQGLVKDCETIRYRMVNVELQIANYMEVCH